MGTGTGKRYRCGLTGVGIGTHLPNCNQYQTPVDRGNNDLVGVREVRYFLSTSSSSFWSSPPVFFLGGQNLPGLGICHLDPSTPKRLRRGREEVAAAQAVTARVFLAVPDGPVLYRPCAPPYYFLCRVCRALKKGRTSCAILSYIPSRAFRVTLGRRAV